MSVVDCFDAMKATSSLSPALSVRVETLFAAGKLPRPARNGCRLEYFQPAFAGSTSRWVDRCHEGGVAIRECPDAGSVIFEALVLASLAKGWLLERFRRCSDTSDTEMVDVYCVWGRERSAAIYSGTKYADASTPIEALIAAFETSHDSSTRSTGCATSNQETRMGFPNASDEFAATPASTQAPPLEKDATVQPVPPEKPASPANGQVAEGAS